MSTNTVNTLKKITIRDVVGKIGRKGGVELPEPGKVKELMSVFGQATEMQEKTTDLGPYRLFRGRFGAVNLVTGEEFFAPKLILPAVAEDLLVAAFGPDAHLVEFGFILGVKRREDDRPGIGYEYTARVAYRGGAEDDPLAHIREAMGKVRALPKAAK